MIKNNKEHFQELEAIVNKLGYQLYDIDYYKAGSDHILNVMIEKQEDLITLDDCITVTQEVNEYLDKHEADFEDDYMLEVSSPGVERKLTKLEHYQSAKGNTIKVKLYKKDEITNQKTIIGELTEITNEKIKVNNREFLFSEIASANITLEEVED